MDQVDHAQTRDGPRHARAGPTASVARRQPARVCSLQAGHADAEPAATGRCGMNLLSQKSITATSGGLLRLQRAGAEKVAIVDDQGLVLLDGEISDNLVSLYFTDS